MEILNEQLLKVYISRFQENESKYNFSLLNGETVRYQEDQCTKSKRKYQIPTRGLFLTCTENSVLFWHT
jgi:hypothetical protein